VKKEARLQAPLAVNAGGKKVLVVDDITDTGETLEKALRYISAQNPKEIRTAVLHHKTVSKLEPDYIAHKIKKWRWVIYPWAIYEDLSTFIVEILKEEKERSSSKILKALAENFNIRMNLRTLQLMLEELETDGKIAMKTMRGLEYWCLK
ncbi:MAG: phosphoribosyltransferase family protein, partial [Candidatus Thermoplasmatota archaeon]|nr:phosphoribosyltransferase family protein [Candidatus Thermoplasmatota archaeon]